MTAAEAGTVRSGPCHRPGPTRPGPRQHAVAVVGQPGHRVTEAQVDQRLGRHPREKVAFDAGLGDIDPRRQRGGPATGKGDGEQLAGPVERPSRRPGDALGQHVVGAARPVEDVEHVPLEADRPRPGLRPLLPGLEHDRRDVPAGQQQRGDQPDRAGPGDQDRFHAAQILAQACNWSQTSRSRSAVQITGRSIPDISSHSRETLNGMQCSKIGQRPYRGASAACAAVKASLSVPPTACTAPTLASIVARKSLVCPIAASTASRPRATAPRPPTRDSAPRAATASSVPPAQSAWNASPVYSAARASTRSPANRIFWPGSQATMSPSVWPRPQWARTTSPRPPPSAMVNRSEKVAVGQVNPGMEAGSRNSLGILASSDSQSCCPRSAISARVLSCVTITSAPNALAPSTRTAW